MHPSREWARRIAAINSCFWLPCPACGQHFGGHEWFRVGGHESGIPYNVSTAEDGTVYAICPDCTGSGVGCRAYLEQGLPVHDGCTFAEDTTTQPSEVHNGHNEVP